MRLTVFQFASSRPRHRVGDAGPRVWQRPVEVGGEARDVVVAQEGAHGLVSVAVELLREAPPVRKRGEVRRVKREDVADGVEEREVELPVELALAHVVHDQAVPVAPRVGLPHKVEGQPALLREALLEPQRDPLHDDVVHVLGRVDAEGVHVILGDEVLHVGRHLLDDRVVLEVEVREVVDEPAVERAGERVPVAGARVGRARARVCREPLREALDVLVLLVDVVERDIEEDADAVLVGEVDHLAEARVRVRKHVAPAELDLAGVRRPVAVEAAELVHAVGGDEVAFGVLGHRREPEEVDAERLEVPLLDRLDDAEEVPALVVRDLRHAGDGLGDRDVRAHVSVTEAVGEHEVHGRVAPLVGLLLDPEGHVGRLLLARSCRLVARPDPHAVLAERQPLGVHADGRGLFVDRHAPLRRGCASDRHDDARRVERRVVCAAQEREGRRHALGVARGLEGLQTRDAAVAHDHAPVLRAIHPLRVEGAALVERPVGAAVPVPDAVGDELVACSPAGRSSSTAQVSPVRVTHAARSPSP